MRTIFWAVGWFFYVAGWIAVVVWPLQLALFMWQGVRLSAAQFVPTIMLVLIGMLFVFLGKALRRRFAS